MAIGITFMPSAQGTMSPNQSGGGNTDLAQAYKILSLRLPRVLGTGAITPLSGDGTNTNSFKGANPYSAVFEAMLKGLTTLSGDRPIDTTGLTPPPSGPPDPGFIYKAPRPDPAPPPTVGTNIIGGEPRTGGNTY